MAPLLSRAIIGSELKLTCRQFKAYGILSHHTNAYHNILAIQDATLNGLALPVRELIAHSRKDTNQCRVYKVH